MPPPQELFDYLSSGGLIEAWNCGFEDKIWNLVCVPQLGWPELDYRQLVDAAAKSRAFAYPGKLETAAEVSQARYKKNPDGRALIKLLCTPRNPTKKNPNTRVTPEEDPAAASRLYVYNIDDIEAEAAVSQLCPDLTPEEQQFEIVTRLMNRRGVGIDLPAVRGGVQVLEQALEQYNGELCQLTQGAVERASQGARMIAWLAARGIHTRSLDEEHRERLLATVADPVARRALEIKGLVGSASVKKLYAIDRQQVGGSVFDLFIYHGARTGRDTGADVQPQNLPKAGPRLKWCPHCQTPSGAQRTGCPACGSDLTRAEQKPWSWEAAETAIQVLRSGSLAHVERWFGDALLTISGCLRSLFMAREDREFISSDYSSIEAVVTAMLAGEAWRIEAFHNKEDIYLHSASRITGTSLADYVAHVTKNGVKHPDRQDIGKPAELGLGFGGWITAWRQFDKTDRFTDEEVKRNILAWRDASPAIVEMWGGQVRGKPWRPDYHELFGFEGCAIAAVLNPGQVHRYRGIEFGVKDDRLFIRLPSGRNLTYHQPRLAPSEHWDGQLQLSYMGWNTNPKSGPYGWIRINTHGGRLTENIVQAIARDFLRDAVLRLEPAGYPVVLRVHDELVCEVPVGFGTVEELEAIMSVTPAWAQHWAEQFGLSWPIRASGGWRGTRFRKDA
jgi:DNA polymerase